MVIKNEFMEQRLQIIMFEYLLKKSSCEDNFFPCKLINLYGATKIRIRFNEQINKCSIR